MADFRPFRGLRYQSQIAGKIDDVLSPPYDVVNGEEQAALRARSAHNVIQLELSEERPGDTPTQNRYSRARDLLAEWQNSGVVVIDDQPTYYVYVQEFDHEGSRQRRTQVLGRLRLEQWEAHVVRPHEETMAKPKADRLEVMRHLRMNVSPVFALYRDGAGHVANATTGGTPLVDATTAEGYRHLLFAITDRAAIDVIMSELSATPLYMLDGHHRYETALAYRDEIRGAASNWTGEEPANFILAAITEVDDPGMVLLPTHRLVRPASVSGDIVERLKRYFVVEDTTPKSYDGTALLRLMARLSAAGRATTAFGALGIDERLHLLTLEDMEAVQALMPRGSKTWRSLDVNVLEYAILRAVLGIENGAGEQIDYTQDAAAALREVEQGRWPLAFLMNATKVSQILAVADAKEKMPPKSTYFYPKLATGLVMHPLN